MLSEAKKQLLDLIKKNAGNFKWVDCMVLHEELQDAILDSLGERLARLEEGRQRIYGILVFNAINNEQVFYRATVELAPSYNHIAYSVKNEGEGSGWEIKIIDCKEIRSRYAIREFLKIEPIKWD